MKVNKKLYNYNYYNYYRINLFKWFPSTLKSNCLYKLTPNSRTISPKEIISNEANWSNKLPILPIYIIKYIILLYYYIIILFYYYDIIIT